MADTDEKYRRALLARQKTFEKRYRPVFDKVAGDISRLVNRPDAKFVRAFSYERAPKLVQKMGDVMVDFEKNILTLTKDDIVYSWKLGAEKGASIAEDYLKAFGKKGKKYPLPDVQEMLKFRGIGEGLSDAVWKTTKQLRWEMDTHLAIGIMNGDSAGTISERIRKYLNNPDDYFRRVRDKNGKLIANQRMKNYHPGRGVYRSAYKNAMRVARTETNRAYLLADHERWLRDPLVVGVKIFLSESHPEYPYPEICEELEGVYPKEFVFAGWHPQCLCHAVPVMVDKEAFREWLRGNTSKPTGKTYMPKNFTDFVNENYEKLSGLKSEPYWMRDNKNVIESIAGKRKSIGMTSVGKDIIRGAKTDKDFEDVVELMDAESPITGPPIQDPELYKRVLLELDELAALYENDLTILRSTTSEAAGSRTWASANSTTMSFNRDWFDDLEAFEKSLDRSVRSRYHPDGTGSVEAVIDHEFGHVMTKDYLDIALGELPLEKLQKIRSEHPDDYDYAIKIGGELTTIRNKYYDYLEEIVNEIGKLLPGNRMYALRQWLQDHDTILFMNSLQGMSQEKYDKISTQVDNYEKTFISDYAKKDAYEFVAEAFAMAMNSESPSVFAREVAVIIRKYFRR